MKQTIIISVLLCLSSVSGAFAQTDTPHGEYRPMYPDGREWVETVNGGRHDGIIHNATFNKIIGDTIIDGKICKKVYQRRINGSNSDISYGIDIVYEHNRIVYHYGYADLESQEKTFIPILDFNLKVGEKTTFGEEGFQFTVLDEDSVTVRGQRYRRMIMGYEEPYREVTRWIEGIGECNCTGPYDYSTTPVYGNNYLISFYQDGKKIFTYEDCYKDADDLSVERAETPIFPYGRGWTQIEKSTNTDGETVAKTLNYKVVGDTIVSYYQMIGDDEYFYYRLAKKVEVSVESSTEPYNYSFSDAFYEKDNMVCGFIPKNTGLSFDQIFIVPMMDFCLTKGDKMTFDDDLQLTVTEVDSVTAKGVRYRRLILSDDTGTERTRWVEGIGSCNNYPGDACNMKFYQDGKEIFTYQDFFKDTNDHTDALEHITCPSNTSASNRIYNLKGQPVTKPRKGELFIKNGKTQFIN